MLSNNWFLSFPSLFFPFFKNNTNILESKLTMFKFKKMNFFKHVINCFNYLINL